MTGMEHTIERAAQVLNDEGAHCGECGREPGDPLSECPDCERFIVGYARALAEAGLLAPAPLTEEWAARYVNGGGAVCRTRREAEAELGRMIHSQRPRIDEPPAPPVAGIYVRHVTAWEPVDGIDRSEGGKAATSD